MLGKTSDSDISAAAWAFVPSRSPVAGSRARSPPRRVERDPATAGGSGELLHRRPVPSPQTCRRGSGAKGGGERSSPTTDRYSNRRNHFRRADAAGPVCRPLAPRTLDVTPRRPTPLQRAGCSSAVSTRLAGSIPFQQPTSYPNQRALSASSPNSPGEPPTKVCQSACRT
jgi:hypothetical protein